MDEWTKEDELTYVRRIGQHQEVKHKTMFGRKTEQVKLLKVYLDWFYCRVWDFGQEELAEIKKYATQKLQRCMDYLATHVPDDWPDYSDPEEVEA